MSLCSVDDVRVHVDPKKITDIEIANIILRSSREVLTKAGSTDETNSYLIEAGVHAAAAMTLKLARSRGELAASVKTPNYEQNNSGIDDEIKQHEKDRDEFIVSYKNSVFGSVFSSPSYHCGFDHCGRH
jgi:hypothetical protein